MIHTSGVSHKEHEEHEEYIPQRREDAKAVMSPAGGGWGWNSSKIYPAKALKPKTQSTTSLEKYLLNKKY
jgi:hypothetical protein